MATLNVKDALSYLDQVKVQFADHPDVYNRFLDIMKDFKSQSIDTPGVIERVSTLFRGHPSLIQGFNTFLPPGYRIECSTMATNSEDDPNGEHNLITVTTPTGTTTQTPGGIGIAGAMSRMMEQQAAAAAQSTAAQSATPSTSTTITPATQSVAPPSATTTSYDNVRSLSPLPATPGATTGAGVLAAKSSSSSSTVTVNPGGGQSSSSSRVNQSVPNVDKRPPVEFNHAISYVNKIKQRFAGSPDTYKQFLEILQTYQKEQRPIQEVYSQVTVLFSHDADLLSEFKQFLPDTSSGAPASGGLFGMLGQVTSGLGSGSGSSGGRGPPPRPSEFDPRSSSSSSSNRNNAQQQPASRKKRAGGSETKSNSAAAAAQGGSSSMAASGSKSKKSKHHHKSERSPPPLIQGGTPPPYAYAQAPDGSLIPVNADGIPLDGSLTSHGINSAGLPLPISVSGGPAQVPLATLSEVAFFDRVKKHIDDRPTYLEFLKLLNLFTQDIINVRTLVDRAALFIGGHTELFSTFKQLCGWDQGTHGWLENDEPVVENVPALRREKVDLSLCKAFGPSYRKLPRSEVNLSCSGRDPMCWEVLNDTWVSHPTWASEGESFNPHKKNVYEDALYRSEEERHEYDYHIEANLRTIALLEPIAARISGMDPEERLSFRLKPGLGGQSKSIYQRVVKKVYGREHSKEVIEALHDNPAVAVPVVLARLKSKDEEWKRAQREWNKVWREVDARNYYKSLDHQGVNFKATDRKAITSRALVGEIESARTSQQNRRLRIDPSLPRINGRYQLAYALENKDTLADGMKLIISFLDRSTFGKNDAERVETFLRRFIPLLLDIDPNAAPGSVIGAEINGSWEDLMKSNPPGVNALFGEDEDEEEEDDEEDNGSEAGDSSNNGSSTPTSSSNGGKKASKKAADLRRQLLKTQAQASATTTITSDTDMNEVIADGSDNASLLKEAERKDKEDEERANDPEGTWIHSDPEVALDSRTGEKVFALPVNGENDGNKSKSANFFCNTQFYTFVRLLQLLYARLQKMRTLASDMASAAPAKSRINPVAMELGLQDPSTGPASVVGAAAASSALANGGAANGTSADEISGLHLPPSRYYDTLLDLTEKLFDQEVDQATYEESVRFMFGINGYIMFTIDKLITALIKTAQTITTDVKSQRLLSILIKDRTRASSSTSSPTTSTSFVNSYKQQIASRMSSEAIIGKDENIFRLEWNSKGSSLLFQMLSRDDLTLDEAQSSEEKWLYYISSYCLWVPTEGLPDLAHAPFLKRNMPKTEEINDPAGTTYTTKSGLEIKVCIRTYKLFFVAETEDSFSRHLPTPTSEASKKSKAQSIRGKKRRSNKFDSWIEKKSKEIDEKSLEEERNQNQVVEEKEIGNGEGKEKVGEEKMNGDDKKVEEEKKDGDVSMEAP